MHLLKYTLGPQAHFLYRQKFALPSLKEAAESKQICWWQHFPATFPWVKIQSSFVSEFAAVYTLLAEVCNLVAYQKELDCILFLSLPREKGFFSLFPQLNGIWMKKIFTVSRTFLPFSLESMAFFLIVQVIHFLPTYHTTEISCCCILSQSYRPLCHSVVS